VSVFRAIFFTIYRIAQKGQAVLDARRCYPESSLADLYDPLTMPKDLAKVHTSLDASVDRLYSKTKFKSDADRLIHLFTLYEKMTSKR